MALKLWTYSGSKNAAKALIAAEYNGVKITMPPFEMGVTNKTPAFLKLNPLGKARARIARLAAAVRLTRRPDRPRPQVPTLETPEGGIFESNAIARYVARLAGSGLFGSTPVQAVRGAAGAARGRAEGWLTAFPGAVARGWCTFACTCHGPRPTGAG